MVRQTTPTELAKKLARLLRPERPDDAYLKKGFQRRTFINGSTHICSAISSSPF